ncbi:MAG: InlB B-repeat-containing protein [Prevotella sp.]|nr:InlB B-repeat-containing protein [Prevotella sp.]
MKTKLFTLLTLLLCAITSAWAEDSATKTYTFDDDVALATDWDVVTDVPSGGTAGCVITNKKEGFKFDDKNGNYLGLSYLNKSDVGITITTTASYSNISEISIDAIANDNSKPSFAAYIVTESGDVEVFAAVGTKDGFATGGTNKWGNKTVTLATPTTGKLKIVTTASSAGKYAALDNIKITYTATPVETFTVTYKANGGTGDDIEDSEASKVAENTFTAPSGKAFAGWNTKDDGTGDSYAVGDDVTENLTLYAQWANQYTVTFDLQGHGNAIEAQNVVSGGKVTEPTAPSASGWAFGGWFKEAACTNAWDFDTDVISATTTLYAKWEEIVVDYTFTPLTSGADPGNGTEILTSTGGKMVKDGGTIKYNENGLSFESTGSSIVTVTLNKKMQAGTVISGVLVAPNISTGRGLKICTTSSTTALGSEWKWNPSAALEEKSFSYTVTSTDGLAGGKSFRVARVADVYLKSLSVSGCVQPYTITLDKNDGESDGTATVSEGDTQLIIATVPVRDGYSVSGYYTAASEGTKVAERDGTLVASVTDYTDASGKWTATSNKTLYAYWSGASKAESITIASSAETSVEKNVAVTLTATVTGGSPEPTVKWYSCTNAEKAGAAEIASASGQNTYSPSTATIGTSYYYATATNESGSVESNVITLTVTGSTACELLSVKFSNGAYGSITTLSAGEATVTVPYLAGESAPTVNELSIEVSADATPVVEGNTITVTAEDGTTTGTYTITTTAYTPLEVTGDIATTTFTAVPSWIYNPYGWDDSKGVKFAKDDNEESKADGNRRISKGNTRQYFFIGAAQTLTLTSGSANNRGIKVYRNGVKLDAPTKTAAANESIDIALDESAPCMIMIESSGNNGDGGFIQYAVTGSVYVSGTITASGWNTFSSNYALDLSDITNGEAYVATTASGNTITLTPCTDIAAAGTGLMIKGTAGETFRIATTTAEPASISNLLVGLPDGGTVTANNNNYVFGWETASDPGFYFVNSTEPTLGLGKAYLHTTTTLGARLNFFFDDETTGITNNNRETITNNGEFFNLAGQRVAQPAKGLYIVNGKKVVIK